MPAALHRDDAGWYAYSANPKEPNVKRIRRYPFSERGDKTAVHDVIRAELGLSPTANVPLELHNWSIDEAEQWVKDGAHDKE